MFIDHLGVASLTSATAARMRRRPISLHLRRFLLVHAFCRHGFRVRPSLAQTAGTMMMRLADADVLPFQFGDLADTIHKYVTEVKKLAADQRGEAKEQDSEIEEGVYQALKDPKKKMVPPAKEPLPPYLNFAPLENASDELTRAAESYDKAFAAAGGKAPAGFNEKLIQTERDQLGEGLPEPSVVQEPGLRSGFLHGLRRQDDSRRAGSHRAKALDGSRRTDYTYGKGPPERGGSLGRGYEGVEGKPVGPSRYRDDAE